MLTVIVCFGVMDAIIVPALSFVGLLVLKVLVATEPGAQAGPWLHPW